MLNPTAQRWNSARRAIANRISRMPDAWIKMRRPGTNEGNIEIMASVFAKCPKAVNANTAAIPMRPAIISLRWKMCATAYGPTSKPVMIVTFSIFCGPASQAKLGIIVDEVEWTIRQFNISNEGVQFTPRVVLKIPTDAQSPVFNDRRYLQR
jgi:hypothetical protein